EWMRTAVRNSGPKVAQALTEVHDWAFDKVLAKPLPLIGAPFKGLKDGPKDKLRWLIDQVNKVVGDPNQLTLCPMSEKLKGAIDTAQASGAPAGPASAVSIAGITSSKVDPKIFERRPPDPNHPELIPAPLDAGFDIRLSGDLVDSTFEPAFDLGIPSLALKLEGGLKIKLSFDAHIIIGIDAHGWYLNTSPEGVDPELKLHLEVTAPNLTLTGSLGFLRATAKDNGTSLVTDMFV